MRPSTFRLIAGGMVIGVVIGMFTTAVARADMVSDYASSHALDICGGLMQYPSVPGVVASFVVAQRDGLTDADALRAVYLVIAAVCPQHMPEWNRFIAIGGEGS